MLGLTTTTLPDIEMAQTDIKGSGIAGTVSWPVRGNLSNFTMTMTWLTLNEYACKFLSQNRGHMISLRAAIEEYDAGSGERRVVPLRIDMRVHATKVTGGKLEVGENMETELEVMLDYLKLTLNDIVLVEVDKFNYKHIVNGEDYLADVAAALGRD